MTKILQFKYTPFIIAFLTLLWYLPNVTPGYTWISAGVDSFDFIFAAKYHLVPHSTGFPVYMLPANLILLIFPNVHPAWLLGLTLSTIPTIIIGLFVFYSIKKLVENWGYESFYYFLKKYPNNSITKTNNKANEERIKYKKFALWAPYVGLFITYSAVVIISQTFIVEIYTFGSMIMMGAITFHLRKQHKLAALFMGLAVGSHGLTWTFVFLLFIIEWKTYLRLAYIIIPFAALPYLYLPFAMHWTDPNEINTLTGNSIKEYLDFLVFGSSTFWWGSLPIWGLPERLWDSIIIWSVSLGLGSLSLLLFFKNDSKKHWKLLIIIGPIMYYWFGTAVQIVYVHLAIAFPMVIIFSAIGLKHSKIHPKYYIIVSLVTLLTLPFFWNLGTTIDTEETAQAYYDNLSLFDTDDHIIVNAALQEITLEGETIEVITDGVAVWWSILMFNKVNNRSLIPISPGKYIFPTGSDDSEENLQRQIKSDEYQNNLAVFGYTPTDVLVFKRDNDNEEWFVKIDGKEINIPTTIYDQCTNDCSNPLRNIFQTHLWWMIDRIFLANSDKTIHITRNIGKEDKKIIDQIYTRNLLPIKTKTAFDQMYNQAKINFNVNVIK